MRYSIVIVTWESADYLGQLVASMNEHLDETPELIVIDNASTDDPESAARAWRGPVKFERLGWNRGFGAAANYGVALARTDVVVLLNPDMHVIDASLSRLAEESLRLNALIGPRLLNADGSIQPSAGGSPVGVWPWIGAFLPGALMPKWLLTRTEPWRLDFATRVTWLTGACIAAPRDLLISLGPFSLAFHLTGEDLDLGLRARRCGFLAIFAPETARLVHLGDRSMCRRYPYGTAHIEFANRRRALRASHTNLSAFFGTSAYLTNLIIRYIFKRLLRKPYARELSLLRGARHR